jgi:hypothetical protein
MIAQKMYVNEKRLKILWKNMYTCTLILALLQDGVPYKYLFQNKLLKFCLYNILTNTETDHAYKGMIAGTIFFYS